MQKKLDARPEGRCDMRPSRIIKDYKLLRQFHIFMLYFGR